jgi:hypothetical protein
MIWPGRAAARAALSWSAVPTATTGPAGGGVVTGGGVTGGVVAGGVVAGGGVVGAVPPAQGAPLIVQPRGTPSAATVKPKLTVAPGATVPFQDTLLNRCRLPVLVRTELHELVTVVPAGRSNSTVQPVAAASPVLVMT